MFRADLRNIITSILCSWPKYLYLLRNYNENEKINYAVEKETHLTYIIRDCLKVIFLTRQD